MMEGWSFGWPQAIVLLVAAQRLAELVLAKRNTRALLAAGAVEWGAGHYPVLVALHLAWLAALLLATPAEAALQPGWLALFLLLQAGRLWVVSTLGRFWTTRIIALPGAPLVARGPYRYCKHPNYVIVAGDRRIAAGLWRLADRAGLLAAQCRGASLAHQGRERVTRAAPERAKGSRCSERWCG